MSRTIRCGVWLVILICGSARAAVGPDAAQKVYEQAAPSLVGVKYTWESEVGRRELIGAGTVVSEDGLVMAPLGVFDIRIPDEQMKDFKIVVPHEDKDPEELEAEFYGRDERTNTAFLKAKQSRPWKPIKFEDVPVRIGEPLISIGMLPQAANYKPYFMEAAVSVSLRGEIPQVLVHGGLAGVGSPVYNADGKAIGVVSAQQGQTMFLNDPGNTLLAINNPPKFFVPTRDFVLSLQDPPTGVEPMKLPWLGIPQLTGINKDVAEVFGLENQPAIQIGEVIPDTPADRAGLKQGQIIVKMNGQPLERGDEPSELPQMFRRQLTRMKVGEAVTFSVLSAKGEPLKEIAVTLGEMPKRPNTAKRWYAEDLGFSARELVFLDTYMRKLPPDAKGVVIALIRPQSAAESGGLQNNDLVTELNRQPVTDLDQFRKMYEEGRQAKPREAVVMVVLRESNTKVIRIEPPQ